MASKWWNSLSPAQKRQYVKDHPNSKYAVGGRNQMDPSTGEKVSEIRRLTTAPKSADDFHKLATLQAMHIHGTGRAPKSTVKQRLEFMLRAEGMKAGKRAAANHASIRKALARLG